MSVIGTFIEKFTSESVLLQMVLVGTIATFLVCELIKRIMNNSEFKLNGFVKSIMLILQILSFVFAAIFGIRHKSSYLVVSLLFFVIMMLFSQIIYRKKIVYCMMVTVFPIFILLSSVISGKRGFSYLSERIGYIGFVVLLVAIEISLIMLYSKCNGSYWARLMLNGVLSILLCGTIYTFTAGIICILALFLLLLGAFICPADINYSPINIDLLKYNIFNNFILVGIPVLMIFISYFVLGPMEIFASNVEEMGFGWGDYLPHLMLECGALAVIFTVFVSMIPSENGINVICSSLFSFSVVSYLQNMFLNRKLVETDGGPLNFESIMPWIKVDTVVWIMGFILMAVGVYFLITRKRNSLVMWGGTGISSSSISCNYFPSFDNSYKSIGRFLYSLWRKRAGNC